MALVDDLLDASSIALDTDSLIYYVEEHQQFLAVIEPVIEFVRSGRGSAHLSVISLLEVLVLPLRENREELIRLYRRILLADEHFTLHELTAEIAERAASLRAQYRLSVADSIVAATAIAHGCEYLITNNGDDFRRVSELNILVLGDYT